MNRDGRGAVIGGSLLVALGIALLAIQYAEDLAGPLILAGLGAAFLVLHLAYRMYGFLVPGGVLLGLGGGLLAQEVGITGGDPVVMGLGLGLVSIFIVDRAITRSGPASGAWWPLIPGGILVAVAVGSAFPDISTRVLRVVWALAIIGLGAVLVMRGVRRGPA